MLKAAGVISKIGYKRDVMDLLGISEQTYRTYVECSLIRPIESSGKRRIFNLIAIAKKFQIV
jgi:DNA-binding transcriptional MerR regulator